MTLQYWGAQLESSIDLKPGEESTTEMGAYGNEGA
jgi:hypothetical protein